MKSYNETIIKKEIPENKTIKSEEHFIYGNFPLHRHEYYEIEYVVHGSGTVVINGTEHTFQPGTAWLSTPTDLHEILTWGKLTIINVSFRLEWIETEILNSLTYGTVINNYDEKSVRRILDEYKTALYGRDLYLKNSLGCMLIDFIRVLDAQETEKTYSHFSHPIGEAMRFLQGHFSDDITLNSVASEVGLSPSYFSSRFHSEVDMPFQTYLVKIRLENAAKFLSSTQHAVTDICYLSGFNNYANFTKAFKKRYNMTPAQYRKEKYLKSL